MGLEQLGVIGNCQIAAHVRSDGAIVWCCLPRFDAEPVFGALLDEVDGGRFVVRPADGVDGTQRYLPNTNVLETTFEHESGSFRVLDFCPRFAQHGRMFRPAKIVRILEPLRGTPLVSVRCDPRLGWNKRRPPVEHGSNHVRYLGFDAELRLTTDLPLSYLDGRATALTRPAHLILSYGAPVEEPLAPLCERFLAATQRYWERWVKHCNVPPRYQAEVIRSALALKLHCYEDTGAIAAALTTSLPESAGTGRTWDYRYCWLRDAYYTLDAFRLLGHFEERERFVDYLVTVAASAPHLDLAPLYRIDGRGDLDERILVDWPGYANEGPVRVGNAAALHKQHDVYGEMVLALGPVFVDDRFEREQTTAVWELLRRLARKAVAVAGEPDAGIWEYRKVWEPQTFSSLMCWAAADRVAGIAERREPSLASELRGEATRIKDEILARAWSREHNCLVSTYGGADLDAALLQIAPLRLLPTDDARMVATIDAIERGLDVEGWLLRYRADDGLGTPSEAFVLCTFWLVEALCAIGELGRARAIMDRVCGALPRLKLLSEHWDPRAHRMWGNYPQAYSHVGLIHAAFAASPAWSEVL